MVKAANEHGTHSRLVLVSSGLHFMVDLKDIQSEPNVLKAMNNREYSLSKPKIMANRYSVSKRTHIFILLC